MRQILRFRAILVAVSFVCVTSGMLCASGQCELLVGAATVDITPEGPIALSGQMTTRVAREIRSPLMATAIALESLGEGRVLDQAVMVSCDLATIPEEVVGRLRESLKEQLPNFEVKKLFLNATHTHTGPVLREGIYDIPDKDAIRPSDYVLFLTERLRDLVVRTWEARRLGAVSWGLGHAVVAQNRRVVYADGHAEMYGRTDVPQFRGFDGYENHDVDVLFIWDRNQKLLAVAVNVACPAQEVESSTFIDADFWHDVRTKLRQRYSRDLLVIGWVGAAGDQSPHLMYRKRAEERMRQLRGLTRTQEIARRICQAVDEAYEVARKDICADVPLVHKVEQITLPVRIVTDEELAHAKAQVKALSEDARNRMMTVWYERIIARYRRQKTNLHYDIESHVMRLGEVAICTNPFELFTDFGIQIKARSRALQTFVIQLAGPGGYVPTERAVRGGGYGAIVESNVVGPEGGQILVDQTVDRINGLWADRP